jgi:acyl-CoA reductase-like NAD-dependent aldehyde dehydrogenase
MQIDHNAVEEYIAAPQDAEIARLGAALNRTYVGYGAEGSKGLDNQMAQDDNSMKAGMGSSIQRAITKSSAHYANPTWDLVDAVDGDVVELAEVDRGALPEEAKALDDEALDAWLDGKRTERAEIQAQLGELASARETFLAEERTRRHGKDANRLDTAIVASILEQAKSAGFTIDASAS